MLLLLFLFSLLLNFFLFSFLASFDSFLLIFFWLLFLNFFLFLLKKALWKLQAFFLFLFVPKEDHIIIPNNLFFFSFFSLGFHYFLFVFLLQLMLKFHFFHRALCIFDELISLKFMSSSVSLFSLLSL